ncbi:Tubulin-tyrosine ligase family, partial [Phytophthora palmivora]
GEMHVEGKMSHSDDFKKFLSTKMGKPEIWDSQMHPRMKEIVVQSLQCVQDMVQHRNNSCELYGYDFMVDENLTPWLIEVNSSPACDYSTPIAQRYVESGLSGIIKVVVDHREYEMKKRSGNAAGLEEPDTGCWRRIHKAEYIGKPMSLYAVDFQVKGSKVQRSRRNAKLNSDGKPNTNMVASGSTSSVSSETMLKADGKADEDGDEDTSEDNQNVDDEGDNDSEDDNNGDDDVKQRSADPEEGSIISESREALDEIDPLL